MVKRRNVFQQTNKKCKIVSVKYLIIKFKYITIEIGVSK